MVLLPPKKFLQLLIQAAKSWSNDYAPSMGAALAYYVVMPTAFHFFLGFEVQRGGLKQEALPAMGDYLQVIVREGLAATQSLVGG